MYSVIQDNIMSSNIDDQTKKKLLNDVLGLKNNKVNVMITGATGCGKSSTINALFKTDLAKIGVGVYPETMSIKKYKLGNLILWDTPGLGDGKKQDIKHRRAIVKKLNKADKKGNALIDLVLVILDGGSRDLGTSYELINEVIIPTIGKKAKDRVLIAINQADQAMKGRNWDLEKNKPKQKLIDFLEDKVESVKKRVQEATGINVEPIYYSSGYKEGDEEQYPWNLSKLLCFIVENTPAKKRLAYVKSYPLKTKRWVNNDYEKIFKAWRNFRY